MCRQNHLAIELTQKREIHQGNHRTDKSVPSIYWQLPWERNLVQKTILAFLSLNVAATFTIGPYVTGRILILEFIVTLALASVTMPVLAAGLVTFLVFEKTGAFGYGTKLPDDVRAILQELDNRQTQNMIQKHIAQLWIQGLVAFVPGRWSGSDCVPGGL